jgi:hypothetical protein
LRANLEGCGADDLAVAEAAGETPILLMQDAHQQLNVA